MTRSVLALVATLLVSACAGDETVAAYGGADREWRLATLNDAPFAANATITFGAGGDVAGQAPCNRYSARNTVPYPWFQLGPILSTKVACPNLAAEDTFFQALTQMTQSEVLGNVLILRDDGGAEMVFRSSD